MDPMTLLQGFTSATAALKDVFTIAKALNNLDLMEKLGNLQLQVATAGQALLESVAEIQGLREQLREAKEALSMKGDIKFFGGLYWKTNDFHPFCTRCYDHSGKLIRIAKHTLDVWSCRHCTESYSASEPPPSA